MEKNALILHGTAGNSQENWFPWLKEKLTKRGYQVWVPDLPKADFPDSRRYNKFILANSSWQFNQHSIIVGHSSGAVSILNLLQQLPPDKTVGACYYVGIFKDNLNWSNLDGLFYQPLDFSKIKSQSRLHYFIHSDNDPYCPLKHAEYLHQRIGGDLIVLPKQKHFSTSTRGAKYHKFPYLLSLIAGQNHTPHFVSGFCTQMTQLEVKIWLDGGWGVDALVGRQTRLHSDLDIVIQKKDLTKLMTWFKQNDFFPIQRGDTSPHNFMYGDKRARFIDVHVIELDLQGNGIYGRKIDQQMYPAAALTGKGKVGGVLANCISLEWLIKFHSGYQLRDKDHHDLNLLKQIS